MTYRVVYTVEPRPDGVEVDDVPDGWGATDAVIVHSLIYPEDGSFSHSYYGVDGRTGGELADVEVFKAWLMMAHALAQSTELAEGQRAVAAEAFRRVQEEILRRRGGR